MYQNMQAISKVLGRMGEKKKKSNSTSILSAWQSRSG